LAISIVVAATAAPIACLPWNYGLEMGLKQSLLIQDLLLEVRTHLAGNLILVSSLEIDFRFPGYVALPLGIYSICS